ncbi:hypothetical protein [Roseivirga sp. E12]|uniref:hypothetical protein n=1 Tax=Roseivirga sp. E12 TaxID=2819237 RepID=UPI001ABD01C2|nr:hypothetical protein [Roseivirga sp. E12]MBO3699392.1 hypothetical protein [Roseivirga sp. E12]
MKIIKLFSLAVLGFGLLMNKPNHEVIIRTADGGAISLNTTKYYQKRATDILLTKTNAEGNEEWFKIYGGSSYDKASDLIATDDGGYAILGSTSSYGNGNYDIYLIKVDKKGKKEWSETYGGFYNEYGYSIKQRSNGDYTIQATGQGCFNENGSPNCDKDKWAFNIDSKGRLKGKQEIAK